MTDTPESEEGRALVARLQSQLAALPRGEGAPQPGVDKLLAFLAGQGGAGEGAEGADDPVLDAALLSIAEAFDAARPRPETPPRPADGEGGPDEHG